MRDPRKDRDDMALRRENMLRVAYRLFSENSITSVSMADIAKEAGCGRKTLFRYYDSKVQLVIAVAVRQWREFLAENRKRRPDDGFAEMSAEEVFAFYLDSFLILYRDHRDLLRFNQFFNIYILSEKPEEGSMKAYGELAAWLEKEFHIIYEKALVDHTIRTDIPEKEMFSTMLHVMLAVVTRYAVGLLYRPGDDFDAMRELRTIKEALLLQYRSRGCKE
ncbi:MAG: TetR/AcrR family transcriptional regulator [Lachnospiraceae bacterium]|nr:TetR/AcrR family transcriptional regulator [Lachnospiraceae bacterium]